MEKVFIILKILWIFLTSSAVSADYICYDDGQERYVYCDAGCCGSSLYHTRACCIDNDEDDFADDYSVWRIFGWAIGAAIMLFLAIILICWCFNWYNRKNKIVIPTQPTEVIVPYYIESPQYPPPPAYVMSSQQPGPSFPAAHHQPIPDEQLYPTKSQERPEGIQGVPPAAGEFRSTRSQPQALGLPGNHNVV